MPALVEFRALTIRHTGQVEVRRERVLTVDGETFRKPAIHVYSPGDDLVGEDDYVRGLIERAWSPAVVAAFLASQPALPAIPEDAP